jgi:glutamate synthase (NADPH/NADH) small chain
MDCGVPFCHNACPVNNVIPDWNDLSYRGNWREALEVLHRTNNFPEFTGRTCPAPCEAACTLNLNDEPVTIKSIESAIVDKGWEMGWIQPEPPKKRTGKAVAIVGSGPAGLAAAQQLARAGHAVVVFEKHDRVGGLLRYGIPDFKMEKNLIDRRIAQLEAEGVVFKTRSHIGRDIPVQKLLQEFDAVILAGGVETPRDLPVPGRGLRGVHWAMDYLSQQNRRVAGDQVADSELILATGKHVVVIGGGDTGSDCIGTARRQGAASITQLEILPKPPEKENKALTWPEWPNKLRTSSSHQEGCERKWGVETVAFGGEGELTAIQCVQVEWKQEQGRRVMSRVPGSDFILPADLVLLAMGFVYPVQEGLLEQAGVVVDERRHVRADATSYRTSVDKVFAAGDMRRGQSLVVWAIREGRQCAQSVDHYLSTV